MDPCTLCGTPCGTQVAFRGTFEFIVRQWVKLGATEAGARRTLTAHVKGKKPYFKRAGYGLGKATSKERQEGWEIGLVVCSACAGKSGWEVGEDEHTPVYAQKGWK